MKPPGSACELLMLKVIAAIVAIVKSPILMGPRIAIVPPPWAWPTPLTGMASPPNYHLAGLPIRQIGIRSICRLRNDFS